ncbi:hypothetical protein [Myroides odoratus]|uniref:Uncharacterized protein n=1 Tax=Myroides odoratus TaxID=256 RepID=A0A9Q6Z381_MYROD|nr:hypothetical protein [Myroides odoratus]EHQ41780.1 hypothetical protein Myrod_0945 [Myroides odoratus DSM 2801]EKB08991.1 hypothetical protein HMPREF9716_00498 [Myroides odoratus CIP 103059]QQT99183.1 hypothetical protein I6I88_13305 [Myroides odoratus]WQD58621.1 hypothetical protein U0010_05660 [Myroides odoratus]STZ29041.1 Uncharacterised protein [Myroides odoratus]
MKKLVLLALALTLFSCTQESNSPLEPTLEKDVQAFTYTDGVTVYFENNTSYNLHLQLNIKPRYMDLSTGILNDTENLMPNGLWIGNSISSNTNKYYNYGHCYPFKDLLNEAGISDSSIDYLNVIRRYLISSIRLKHPVTGEIIQLSPFDSQYNSSSSLLSGVIFTNNTLSSPWGKEVFYKEGPQDYTVLLPNGLTHRFRLTLDTTSYKLVLTVDEY